MTREEFEAARASRPCRHCDGAVVLEHNPNNNGLQVVCGACRARSPWGPLVYIKQNNRKRRRPLPDGETLDSIWARWGDICFVCGAPKTALIILNIGREAHHVLPYASHGHQGPIVPICKLCHSLVTERQRLYWFIQRLVVRPDAESLSDSRAGLSAPGLSRDSVRAAREATARAVEGLPDDDADA